MRVGHGKDEGKKKKRTHVPPNNTQGTELMLFQSKERKIEIHRTEMVLKFFNNTVRTHSRHMIDAGFLTRFR